MMTQLELMRENGRLRAALQEVMIRAERAARYGASAYIAIETELEFIIDASRSALTGNELASDLARCEG